MKKFKRITGWLHLWLGLAAGLILIIVALTGSLLTFEDELEPMLFKDSQVVQPMAQRLPVDSLVQIANTVFADKKASRFIISGEADRSIEVRYGVKGDKEPLKVAFINPYTGKVLYKGRLDKMFFQQVRSLHRFLLMGETGKIITGISCTICIFLVISGLVIWWPANKHAIKQRFQIKWDASGKRLTWDLHAVSGFYLSIILLMVTLTGFVWSHKWADNLLFLLADGKPAKIDKVKNVEKLKQALPGVYETMFNEINAAYPYKGAVAYTIPPKPNLAVTVQKEPESSVMRHIDAAYFDSHTGQLIKTLPYEQLTRGARIRRVLLPIHTGALLGWPTKLLYLIMSLFTASLPVTGLLIWLGKNKKAKKPGRRTMRKLDTTSTHPVRRPLVLSRQKEKI